MRSVPATARAGLALLWAIQLCSGESPAKDLQVRLAFSNVILSELNENDAEAAVKSWAQAIAADAHLDIEGSGQFLRSEEILLAISNHLVEGFAISTPEYAKVSRFVDPVIYLDQDSPRIEAEYVLLVRQDSGIHDLAGLRGHTLLAYQHIGMSLASAWLETVLAAANLDSPERFFGKVSKSTKIPQAILPVYFGRTDACLVTRRGFDTMAELNPQLRQKLQIVAASPKVVASLLGVHKDTPAAVKSRMREALLGMSAKPSGRQILALFQCQQFVALDSSVLHTSLELLAASERLKARKVKSEP